MSGQRMSDKRLAELGGFINRIISNGDNWASELLQALKAERAVVDGQENVIKKAIKKLHADFVHFGDANRRMKYVRNFLLAAIHPQEPKDG